jgi:uncharacterized membrane protein
MIDWPSVFASIIPSLCFFAVGLLLRIVTDAFGFKWWWERRRDERQRRQWEKMMVGAMNAAVARQVTLAERQLLEEKKMAVVAEERHKFVVNGLKTKISDLQKQLAEAKRKRKPS